MKNDAESPYQLPTGYQVFIHQSRYARYLWEKGRRETWPETVKRYFDFFQVHLGEKHGFKVTREVREELETAMLRLEILPSMRCLMTAGEALERDHAAGYNCSYLAMRRAISFDELFYILLCGTGAGFTIERQVICDLPTVAEQFFDSDTVIHVADSKVGWCKALKELVGLLYSGQIPRWDTTKVRKAGAPLKTFGGRASGPEPLEKLFRQLIAVFRQAAARKLNSIEVHDICCMIADAVVVGGVRRSALISLSNLSDDRMRHAKSGDWRTHSPWRTLANNSWAATEKPEVGIFMKEWLSLYESKSGERGIFNRVAAQKQAARYGFRDGKLEYGVNPCGEIILRDREFCNLSTVIARPTDTIEDLKRKVRLATILGTWQSTLTDFRYLSSSWKKNCEEERLLGVSINGVMDNSLLNHMHDQLEDFCVALRLTAREINTVWAKKLKINPSCAITCFKPEGTTSQLVLSGSGVHEWHAQYYLRNVRCDKKDPLAKFMADMGFPVEDDVMKPETNYVFSFPISAPRGAVLRGQRGAIQQLDHWLTLREHYCEHNPSITVSVKEHEWMDVGAWVYRHFDKATGLTFLPFFESDHNYRQLPYQTCTESDYNAALAKMPQGVQWDKLAQYETGDSTAGSRTMACSGDSCEVVDLIK